MTLTRILVFSLVLIFCGRSLGALAGDSSTAFLDLESTTAAYEIPPLMPAVEEEEEVSAQSRFGSDGVLGEDRENNKLLPEEEAAVGHLAEDTENFSDGGCLSLLECPNDRTPEPTDRDNLPVDALSTSSEEYFPELSEDLHTTATIDVTSPTSQIVNSTTEVRETQRTAPTMSIKPELKATTSVTPQDTKSISNDEVKVTENTNINDIFPRLDSTKNEMGTSTENSESNESDLSAGQRKKSGKKPTIPKHESPSSTVKMFETSLLTNTQENATTTVIPSTHSQGTVFTTLTMAGSQRTVFSSTTTTATTTSISNSTVYSAATRLAQSTPLSTSLTQPTVFSTTPAVTLRIFPYSPTEKVTSVPTSGSSQQDTSTEGKPATTTSHPILPKLTNPHCTLLPVCVKVHVTGEPPLCGSQSSLQSKIFRKMVKNNLARYLSQTIIAEQVVLELPPCNSENAPSSSSEVLFFVTDSSGEYEEVITSFAGVLMKAMAKKTTDENHLPQVVAVEVIESSEGAYSVNTPHAGIVAAVAISSVAGACLCLLCILLLIMKHRLSLQQRRRPAEGSVQDNYSLDSFAVNASFRRRLHSSSFLNHAFANDDYSELPSKPLTVTELANVLHHHRNNIAREFEKLPMNMPKLDKVPAGAEVKNRYANVVPNPLTRVILSDASDDPVKGYINANYVKGHNSNAQFYIACQSPLPEYVADFWKMVWEQQSRLIIMLTLLEENGVSRCAPYFPESTLDFRQLHGNYEVSLLKKDVHEFYTASTFRVTEVQKNLFRDVLHLWYRAWPAVGVPSDPSSLVTFLLHARRFMNCNSGPTIVHCSTGTGRTGVLIALDICMRQYEESRHADVVHCVSKIRLDRGGAVQNKDQYILIHEALLEYASCTANQSNRPSIAPSTQ